MKIPINLASQPFRRDRAMLVASVAVSLLLVGTLGGEISLATTDRAQLANLRAEVSRIRTQLQLSAGQQQSLDGVLRQPQNAEVLERSVFLNTLLYRKGISWTRILSDLEKTMPAKVKVLNIKPSVIGKGQVTLDMLVGAESAEPVIDLYKALERSELFGAVTPQSVVPPSQSEPLYRYRFTVNYAQKL
jgi:type IV pilus assembly protein PilN